MPGDACGDVDGENGELVEPVLEGRLVGMATVLD